MGMRVLGAGNWYRRSRSSVVGSLLASWYDMYMSPFLVAILVCLGSSSQLLRFWHWLLTLVHGFGLNCFLRLLGGVVVNRCLQIAGTVGSGGGCRCTPLVARDRLGLVVRSRHRSRAVNCRRHRPRRACAAPGVADGLTWVRFSEARLRRNHRSVRWEGQKRPSRRIVPLAALGPRLGRVNKN